MQAVVTSDWQVQWANLDKCRQSLKELIALAKKEKIKTIVHCGDLKHHYSPVDVRVTNFGVEFVQALIAEGLKVIILLGNHDRVSMSAASDDWFPALKAAGAITISRPQYLPEYDIAAVPFLVSAKNAKRAFRKMANLSKPSTTLIFHNGIRGCKINIASRSDTDALTLNDLQPSKYALCLGGHIHLHQKMGSNCYFVGSPFAQDWGEANQRKGFMVVRGKHVSFVETSIPGMYDPSLPGFSKATPKKWENCSIRVHIPFDPSASIAYQPFINKAVIQAKKQYPGADITVVPEFVDTTEVTITADGSDSDTIRTYVEKTHTGSTEFKEKLCAYLITKLEAHGVRSDHSRTVEFLSASAENFLCFKKVKLTFSKGITVVTGMNKDWVGRNNGSGKTSLMQLPIAALVGQTFKGQTANALVRRGIKKKDKSYVRLKFRTADKRECVVVRRRKPVGLDFRVGKKDYAVGIGQRGTQSEIERLTGLSIESIRNSMYVDQGEVSTILAGSDAERKFIFSKFLGLERFFEARKVEAEKLKEINFQISEAEKDKGGLQAQIDQARSNIRLLGKQDSLKLAEERYQKRADAFKQAKISVSKFEHSQPKGRKGFSKKFSETGLRKSASRRYSEYAAKAQRLDTTRKLISKLSVLSGRAKCPTCNQVVSTQHLANELASQKKLELELRTKVERLREARHKIEDKIYQYQREREQRREQLGKLKLALHEAELKLHDAKAALTRVKELEKVRDHNRSVLHGLKKKLDDVTKYIVSLKEEAAFLQYCVKAFGKDGVPAFIVSSIVPKLNAAAKKYAKLFSEDEIQVRFHSEEGDIDVEVLNFHGGQSLKDQSAGETRVAGIVTSFAVRDIINPSNLLILDEPGESLDEINAKVFAEGLRVAAKDLGCVLITTHNPFILGELKGERLIEVVKRNGVSRISNVQ